MIHLASEIGRFFRGAAPYAATIPQKPRLENKILASIVNAGLSCHN
jgi:hypothetical protein